jgi:outer membrane protein TolC
LINNVVATALAETSINATIDAIRQIIDAEQGTLKLLHGQERYGTTAPADVLRAPAPLAATRANLSPLEEELAFAGDSLAILTGHVPATFNEPDITFKDLALPRRLRLPSNLVRQRPDAPGRPEPADARCQRTGGCCDCAFAAEL